MGEKNTSPFVFGFLLGQNEVKMLKMAAFSEVQSNVPYAAFSKGWNSVNLICYGPENRFGFHSTDLTDSKSSRCA